MKNTLTNLGSILSLGCLLHCIIGPLIISFLPLIGASFLYGSNLDLCLMLAASLMSLAGLCWGFFRHGRKSPLFILAVGMAFFIISHQIYHHILFSLFTGVAFFAANLLNRKMCNNCSNCHE